MNKFTTRSTPVATRPLRTLLAAARNGHVVVRAADLICVAGETRLQRMDPCGVDAGFTLTAANVVGGIGPRGVRAVDAGALEELLGKARTATFGWSADSLVVNGRTLNTASIESPFSDLQLERDRPIRSGRFDPERLGAVAAAAGTSCVRYALNGVNFDFDAHCLVASDGARLHASNGDTLSANSLGPKSVIVPTAAARQMVACHIDEIRSDGNVIVGIGDGLTLRTYAIDGEFPAYERLLRPREALVPVPVVHTALDSLRLAASLSRRSKLAQAGIEIPSRPGVPTLQRTGVKRHVELPPVLAAGLGAASIYLCPIELRAALLAAGSQAQVLVPAENSPSTESDGDRRWATAPVHVVSASRPHFRAVVLPLPQ